LTGRKISIIKKEKPVERVFSHSKSIPKDKKIALKKGDSKKKDTAQNSNKFKSYRKNRRNRSSR